MEATLAMASLGRFNPDGPHLKMTKNMKNYPIYGHFNPENIPRILPYEWFEKEAETENLVWAILPGKRIVWVLREACEGNIVASQS